MQISLANEIKKEVRVDIKQTSGDLAIGTITTSKTINGETTTETQEIEGTVAEIKAKVNELPSSDGNKVINIGEKTST